MAVYQHDVLIVGGGGAGLRAAIAVAEANPRLSVAIASKVYPMRSHTVSAEGGAAAVTKPNDSIEDHIYDTISGGDWLSDQDAVEAFVKEAPHEMIQLEHWGCPWSREPSGHVAVRPFGGMKIERTWFAADKTGFHMLHALFQTSLKYRDVIRYDEWSVLELVVDGGRCQGVVALQLSTGELHVIGAKAVILCTGGAGKAFPFTTNAAIKTGDGMALAYRAGVALKDMEFVQYHPTGLPGTGILITEATRGEGGILVDKDGYRYLQDYDLGKPLDISDPKHPQKRTMELGPRDRLSQAFYWEWKKGNTIETEYGAVMHLDIRHLGEEKIDKKLPFVRELCTKYVGVDPVSQLIPVRPVVHYMMGGVDTDIQGATPISGLYAAGECACVSINGANRLGSNSLTELLVFGARSGRHAAELAAQTAAPSESVLKSGLERFSGTIAALRATPGDQKIAHIRRDLHAAMEEGAGIYRDQASLEKTCSVIRECKERAQRLELDDRGGPFDTEILAALEIGFLLDVAEAVAYSALRRTESRGSHQRLDHKTRDDANFLKHSLAYRTNADPRIDYKPVVITKWPPGKREYGVESGLKRDKASDKPAGKPEAQKHG